VLDIVLASHEEFVDNVKICEPLWYIDHNQIQFSIKVKSGIGKYDTGDISTKEDIRTFSNDTLE